MPTWKKPLKCSEMFKMILLILPNLDDMNRKETIAGNEKLFGVFSNDFELACDFLASNK